MLNNVLRVVGSRGVGYNQLGRHSILSDRVVRVAIRFLEEDGWLTIKPSDRGRDKLIQLTPERHPIRPTTFAFSHYQGE